MADRCKASARSNVAAWLNPSSGTGLHGYGSFVYKCLAVFWKQRVMSRRERALAKLSGIDPKNTFIRRSIAKTIFFFALWCGFVSGFIAVSTGGILLMGGPTLLVEVWNQKEAGGPYQHRLFAFGFFCDFYWGLGGSFLRVEIRSVSDPNDRIVERRGY